MLKKGVHLALIVFPALIGSAIGFAAQSGTDPWYADLNKPIWNPPPALFGPVWTFLYLAMGFASQRIWNRRGWGKVADRALGLYFAQLIFNFFWTPLFFFLHRPLWALVDIAALFALIIATQKAFCRIDHLAGYLLWPYAVWVAFAALLNFRLWQLNG